MPTENKIAAPEESADAFTATDMINQSAQAFRDGQAAVEQAAAQDELIRLRGLSVENILLDVVRGDGSGHEVYAKSVADVEAAFTKAFDRIEALEDELATRPAQTEQQPFGWVTEDYLTDKSATTYDQVVADRWRAKGWPVREIYAAPIAQNEKKPVAMVDANDDGMWADILPDVTVKVGQMLYAAPIAQTAPQTAAKMPCGTAVTNVYEAYEAGKRAAAPQPEQSGWISVEDRLPEVAAGDEGEFIVCVYRSHNGESYSFSARFLNDYPLHTDYDDEPTLHSGWYDVKERADYDGWYSLLIDEKSGDKVTHWMPLPAAPALAAQGGAQ